MRIDIIARTLKAFHLNKPIWVILALLALTDLSIFLDVSIFRQVLGFTLIYMIPGVMILNIIGLKKLGILEKFVLATGLSISFLMFSGLFINILFPLFGYDKPLSRNSVVISFSVILILLAIFASLRDQRFFSPRSYNLKLNTREKVFLLLPSLFPILSVLGMHLMNTTDNNVILMALLFLIPAYAIFIAVIHNNVPERAYPLIVFSSSLSLVLLQGLRSSHIIGSDIHLDFYLFQQTIHNEQWRIIGNSSLDSCLSISILPTMFQSFLDIDPEYLFKILYPIIFSVSPLIIYIISKKYIGNFYAFLASLFFMSQSGFLWAAYISRTVVAIFFFALSIMVLYLNDISEAERRLLFIIFAVSCIVSHYSTTYIFFLVLSLTWLCMQTFHTLFPYSKKKPALLKNISAPAKSMASTLEDPKNLPKSIMTIGIVVLLSLIHI